MLLTSRLRREQAYFSELNRHEIEPPIHDTMRMPTLCSFVPQLKSFSAPLGPDPEAQYGVVPNLQPGSKVSVVWPV